jgi:TonB family protein
MSGYVGHLTFSRYTNKTPKWSFLTLPILAALLSACGGSPDNPDVTTEQFSACRAGDSDKYSDECEGKTVTLTAIVNHYSSDGVRMSIRTRCDSKDELFSVDAANLDLKYSEKYKDKCVKVFAEIGPENTIYPDINVKETIWVESAKEFVARKDHEKFITGGWKTKEEYESAKEQGYHSRSDWLAEMQRKRVEFLANADWEQMQQWPAAISGFSFSISEVENGCEKLIEARWSDYKNRTIRRAYPTIYNATTQSVYMFMFNEEIDQREVLVDRLWPVWRSKKSPNHYLFYSPITRFSLWEISNDGNVRTAVLQRDGKIFGSSEYLSETVDIMNKVRPNIESTEFYRYGIMPDESGDTVLRKCDRKYYQTIENLSFPLREKGSFGRLHFTINQALNNSISDASTVHTKSPNSTDLRTQKNDSPNIARPKNQSSGNTLAQKNLPQSVSQARAARAKDLSLWAARIQENYPTRALRDEIQGSVGVRVTVTAEGRAVACSITESSGFDILDKAACESMERYARFEPALDYDGYPTTGNYSQRITYRLSD